MDHSIDLQFEKMQEKRRQLPVRQEHMLLRDESAVCKTAKG